MRKIISYVIALTLLVSLFFGIAIDNNAYAFTLITDAQDSEGGAKGVNKDAKAAMQKNAKACLELVEKAEISNDITEDDFTEMLYGACKYSAHKDYGTSIKMYEFEIKKATASKEGLLKASVGFSQDSAEEVVKIEKVISKLEGGLAEEEEDNDEELAPAENLGENFDYKTEFRNAETAISGKFSDFAVSNNTTKNDILKMAQNALPKGSKTTVKIESENFSLIKATTTVNGTLSVTLTLTCGTQTKKFAIAKTIEEVVTENSKKIAEDRSAVGVAINKMTFNNRTTKEEILADCKALLKNGTKISWKSFSMQKATFNEEGKIIASLKFVLGEEERVTELDLDIPKLVRKVPTDKLSLNGNEWEILRITNTARIKVGVPVVTMTEVLQDTADIREAELLELYSHTRPNGKLCFTALPDNYKYSGAAENIAECVGKRTVPLSAEDMTIGWINSPGHYANLTNGAFSYVGMGYLSAPEHIAGVQMFTGGSTIESVETSAGTLSFYDTDDLQKEYLICTAVDGNVSYVPLDIEQMEKVDGGYKLNMYSNKPVIFTITGENAAKENTSSTFTDISEDAYYASAVKWAIENNITAGTSTTTFSPDDTCTRAQIIMFMWRALGKPEPTIANPFNDVKNSDYYFKPAVWAYEKGMITEKSFEAETPCRRCDTMKYFWLYAGSPVAEVASFSDVSAESDCFNAINWAVANKITSGTSDTTFSPNLICSRAEIVTFLLRAINILK